MFESGMGSRIRHERGGLPEEVPSRLLTKPASGVLASLRGSTYEPEYASPLRSLWPCWTAFLNSLRGMLLPVVTWHPVRVQYRAGLCQHTASADDVNKTCSEMALVIETTQVVSDNEALMKTIVTSRRNRAGVSPLNSSMRFNDYRMTDGLSQLPSERRAWRDRIRRTAGIRRTKLLATQTAMTETANTVSKESMSYLQREWVNDEFRKTVE